MTTPVNNNKYPFYNNYYNTNAPGIQTVNGGVNSNPNPLYANRSLAQQQQQQNRTANDHYQRGKPPTTYNNSKMSDSFVKTVTHDDEPEQLASTELDALIDVHATLFKSILSKIKKPQVTDIQARRVLIRLEVIDLEPFIVQEKSANQQQPDVMSIFTPCVVSKFQNLNYTLELSCDSSNNFYRVYNGDANEITLEDLKPNTKYYLRVLASLGVKCEGDYTVPVSFQTQCCEPDQPAPPKLVGVKKKNELPLKWNSCNDNGAKITNFILEYRQVNENEIYADGDDDADATADSTNNSNQTWVIFFAIGRFCFSE